MQLPIVGGYTARKHTKSLFIVFQSKLAETRFGYVCICCSRLLSIDCARAPDAIQFQTFSSLSWAGLVPVP